MLRDPMRGIGRFEGNPRVEFLPAPKGSPLSWTRVMYLEEFGYRTCEGKTIIVPKRFVSDGASIPSPLWMKFGHPLTSRNILFGGPHDFIYRTGVFTQDQCDMYLWDMAILAGHSEVDALEIYEGVHQFGKTAYDENANKRRQCGGDFPRLLSWA
jgi:hypothetical protein